MYFSLGQKREESRDELGGLKGRSGRNVAFSGLGGRGRVRQTRRRWEDWGKLELAKEMREDGMGKVRGLDLRWEGRNTGCQNFINENDFSCFRLAEFKFRIRDNNPPRLGITRRLS